MVKLVNDRQRLVALLGALEQPRCAAELLDVHSQGDRGLLDVARAHRLTPLLSVVCGDYLPAALAGPFRRDRVVTVARNLVLSQVAAECVRALADAGMRAVLLKGLAYDGTLYREAGARPTGDVDLLVAEEARRAAFEVMDRLAFEPRAAAPGFDDPDYHEVAWTRGEVEVDLHLALAPIARCNIDYRAVWDAIRPAVGNGNQAFILAPSHAAVFHALHMAIDHFAVPAVYLVDLTRLLPTEADFAAAEATARAWRVHRPFATAVALAATFLPRWAAGRPFVFPPPPVPRVLSAYGFAPAIPRAEQLRRKLLHFDTARDAIRYVAVQTARNGREWFERRIRRRSPRERLGLGLRNP